MVVYTGKYTKLSQNQKVPPSKFSTIDRRLNKSVVAIFVFKMFCVIVVTIGSAFFNVCSIPLWRLVLYTVIDAHALSLSLIHSLMVLHKRFFAGDGCHFTQAACTNMEVDRRKRWTTPGTFSSTVIPP